MADYIDREKFIKKLNSEKVKAIVGVVGIAWVKSLLSKIPNADVVEVLYGYWIEADSTRKGQKFVCSVCKGVSYYPQPTRDKKWVKHCGYSHCPHCLAKMDGKDGAE